MSEEEPEEETYSLIFRSLKHPVRRRILRMLANRPLAFSEILEGISIDSGHMTYHLESLGELITHAPDGKYALSSIGMAAIRLMSGVEEQVEEKTSSIIQLTKKQTILKIVTIAYLILLVFALVPFSLFAYQYTVSTVVWERTFYVLIPSNQTFSHNFTIVYGEYPWEYSFDNHSSYFKRPMPVRTATYWEEDYAVFRLETPRGFFFPIYRLYDSQGLVQDGLNSIGLRVIRWIELPLPKTIDGEISPIFINLTDLLPTNTLILDRPIVVDKTFKLKLDAVQSNQPSCATLIVGLRREGFTRPYYYHGIAGFVIAAIYPTGMFVRRLLMKRKP